MRKSKSALTKSGKLSRRTLPTDMERPLEEFSDSIAADESTASGARQNAIQEAAYYRAERRGFAPGHELDDWLSAEADIIGGSLQRISATSSVQ